MSSTWRDIDAYLLAKGIRIGAPTPCSTDGSRDICGMHVQGSNHYKGLARDYGDAASDCRAIVAALRPYAIGANPVIIELFYAPTNTWLKDGVQLTRMAIGDHDDHVHAAIDPGKTLVVQAPVPTGPSPASIATVVNSA